MPTETKAQENRLETTDTQTTGIVEFTEQIQKPRTESGIYRSRIIDTQYHKINDSWYDMITIEFGHKNEQSVKCYYPVYDEENIIDEDLQNLYNYLNKNPSNVTDNNIIGEKVPLLINNGDKTVFIPTSFTNQSILNKLVYSNYIEPTKEQPKFDIPKRYLFVLSVAILPLAYLNNILVVVGIITLILTYGILNNMTINGSNI